MRPRYFYQDYQGNFATLTINMRTRPCYGFRGDPLHFYRKLKTPILFLISRNQDELWRNRKVFFVFFIYFFFFSIPFNLSATFIIVYECTSRSWNAADQRSPNTVRPSEINILMRYVKQYYSERFFLNFLIFSNTFFITSLLKYEFGCVIEFYDAEYCRRGVLRGGKAFRLFYKKTEMQ